MAQRPMVLTLIATDRPGLVGSLSDAVADHGGNWVESRMARLGGKFAGVLRVDVPAERAEALTAALRELEQSIGLHIHIEPAEAEQPELAAGDLGLQLLGHDRPGLVREVSHALAQRQVNVIELRTERFDAPMSGEAMFKAAARLRCPKDLSLEELHEALEAVADELSLDLDLNENVPDQL